MTLHDLTAGDVCGTLLTAGGFHIVFNRARSVLPRFAGWMQWVWITIFLAVSGIGFFQARSGNDVLGTIISAWLLAGVAGVATAAFLPPVDAVWRGWKDRDYRRALKRLADLKMQSDAERSARQQQWAEAHRAYLESRPKPPPPPPPPTRQQIMEAAKQRRDDKLRLLQQSGLTGIRLKAAERRIEAAYLKEIDGVIS
jgi:hypothetical protein